MKVVNYGSLNIDIVYRVAHIVSPGETILSSSMDYFPGGKGLNQSVALSRAGCEIFHAGIVGKDGDMLLDVCRKSGVNTDYITVQEEPTGNAIIQVSDKGENSIVLYGGANQCNSAETIERVLKDFGKGDWLLVQNEINAVDMVIDRAYQRKMRIAFNPAPMNKAVLKCDLGKVDILLLNEVECLQLTGKADCEEALAILCRRYPKTKIVLTLGKDGVIYQDAGQRLTHGVYDVPVVDTTGAGDTFIGFFLAAIFRGEMTAEALRQASIAASLCVSKDGAADSVPTLNDVLSCGMQLCIQF